METVLGHWVACADWWWVWQFRGISRTGTGYHLQFYEVSFQFSGWETKACQSHKGSKNTRSLSL